MQRRHTPPSHRFEEASGFGGSSGSGGSGTGSESGDDSPLRMVMSRNRTLRDMARTALSRPDDANPFLQPDPSMPFAPPEDVVSLSQRNSVDPFATISIEPFMEQPRQHLTGRQSQQQQQQRYHREILEDQERVEKRKQQRYQRMRQQVQKQQQLQKEQHPRQHHQQREYNQQQLQRRQPAFPTQHDHRQASRTSTSSGASLACNPLHTHTHALENGYHLRHKNAYPSDVARGSRSSATPAQAGRDDRRAYANTNYTAGAPSSSLSHSSAMTREKRPPSVPSLDPDHASNSNNNSLTTNMSFASTLYHTNNARVDAISDAGVMLHPSVVRGDGRCLFRAIARCRYVARASPIPSERVEREEADALRLRAVAELKKHRELLARFFVIEGNFAQYVRKMSHPRTYGGEPELLVLAKLLHVPIAVYIVKGERYRQIQVYGKQYRGDPLRILYSDGIHYDALLPCG